VDRPEQTATEVAVPWHSPTVAAGEKKKSQRTQSCRRLLKWADLTIHEVNMECYN